MIERGAYLAAAGDCAACHTAKGGAPFAGGLYMPTPFGEISTPNITPDRRTGIGAWTDEQFYRAMHDGIGHRGEYLYPVMPFPWYTIVTREDVSAIRAYLQTVPAVSKAKEPNRLKFPASIRSSLLAWRQLFFKAHDFKGDPAQSDAINRGAYLVNGLAHCGECHNGRPALGATSGHREALAGGVIDNWYAPNISSDARSGVGSWSNQQIATYLKTGVSPAGGVAAGPMAETVHSLSKLTDDDLLAMAAYLKTTEPQTSPQGKQHELFSGSNARGGDTYVSFCASCHGVNGEGLAGAIPALNNNGAVKAAGPQDVINVVLGGLQARKRYAPMLAIGAGMTDEQIADVVNFVRQNWDNHAPPTAQAGMVEKLRTATTTSLNPASPIDCANQLLSTQAKLISQQVDASAHGLGDVNDAEMPARVPDLIKQAHQHAPKAAPADLVNGLTAGYCKAQFSSGQTDRSERALRLGHFSELVYSAANGQKFK
ncbi:MAG: cytochrome c [Ideonella sp.]